MMKAGRKIKILETVDVDGVTYIAPLAPEAGLVRPSGMLGRYPSHATSPGCMAVIHMASIDE